MVHEKWLGSTVDQIAQEKAGIIRPHSVVVSAPQLPQVRAVLMRKAAQVGAHIAWVAPLTCHEEMDYADDYSSQDSVDRALDVCHVPPSCLDEALEHTAQQGDNLSRNTLVDDCSHHALGAGEHDSNSCAHAYRTEVEVVARKAVTGGQILDIRTPQAIYQEIYLPLHGAHQALNAAAALRAVELALGDIALAMEVVSRAFAAVASPGRCELISADPVIVVDAAHNPDGALSLRRTLEERFESQRLIGVFSALRDKEVEKVLAELEPVLSGVVVTEMAEARAMPLHDLAEHAHQVLGNNRVRVASGLSDALSQAISWTDLSQPNAKQPVVIIFGSVALAGKALELVNHMNICE